MWHSSMQNLKQNINKKTISQTQDTIVVVGEEVPEQEKMG